MSKTIGVECARLRCIALAEPNSAFCAAHRGHNRIRKLIYGEQPEEPDWSRGHLQPVTDRIEYEKAEKVDALLTVEPRGTPPMRKKDFARGGTPEIREHGDLPHRSLGDL